MLLSRHTRRREFIALVGGAAAAWPLPARAQKTGRLARIGVLMGYPETDSEAKALLGEFTHALSEFGGIERQNLHMDVRWAPAKTDLMRTFAKELVNLQPDLIFTDSIYVAILRPPL
jgi:putative tryptophan/tyrosine transport system substrate-binding protein